MRINTNTPFDIVIKRIFELSNEDFDEIERVSLLSDQVTPFHSRYWIQAIGSQPESQSYCALMHTKGVVSGYMLFDVQVNVLGIKQLLSPSMAWVTPYGGPVYINQVEVTPEAFILKCAELRKCKYAYILGGPFSCLPVNESNGHEFTSSETSVIDLLSNEEALFKNLHGKTRNMIRKARKSGVTVMKESLNSLPIMVKMLESTLSEKGVRTAEIDLLEKLYSAPDTLITMLFARVSEEPVAGIVNLHYHGTSYYWLGASFPSGRRGGINELLQWQAILLAKQMGSSRYDMVRIDRDSLPGIARFKLRFGGSSVSIPVITWRSALWNGMRNIKNALVKK